MTVPGFGIDPKREIFAKVHEDSIPANHNSGPDKQKPVYIPTQHERPSPVVGITSSCGHSIWQDCECVEGET